MQSESADLKQSLLSVLECPVCMEYMRPPIILCVNGHNICNICRPKLDDCPTCRKRFLSTRNVGLEKLAQEVKYPCTYLKFGCNEVFAHNKLVEHQAACRYGQLTCPAAKCSSGIRIVQCDWTGNYKEVKNHLMEDHLEMCFDYGEVELTSLIYMCSYALCDKFVFVYNEVFFRQFCKRNDMFYVVVRYIGPPENAAKYKYKVKFVNKDDTEGVTVMNLTRSSNENLDDVFKSGNCGKLHYDVVNRLTTQKACIKFKLEILKVGN